MNRISLLLACCLLSTGALGAEPVDFLRDVRPILSRHCFQCHGPDDGARQAGLRLDSAEGATRAAESGSRPIVPGKPEQSELVRRIFSADETEAMPPAEAKKPLTSKQKEVLRQWIAEGAPYRPHWAFVPPVAAALPKVSDPRWPRNALDRFVLARLEREGLDPSAPADPYTLARRASLDLRGLPPTAQELDAFVNDSAPDAYERYVDRLLASPHYGERWARRWLDLARYADTNGYEKDRPRSIWPFRDWVIRSLNDDLPFDQFTIRQLAGDLIEPATLDNRVATGFHRNTMLNEEGGIDPLEFRFYAMVDRVNTTATTWLGLTMGCAQCHTHKFDPVSQREYYQVMAFLNNAEEPLLELPDPTVAARRADLERQVTELEAALASKFPPLEPTANDTRSESERRNQHREQKFAAWLQQERARAVFWQSLRPTRATANLPVLTIQPDDSVLASGDQTKSDTYTLDFKTGLRSITALRLEALPDDRLPKHGPGRTYYEGPLGDFFLSEFKVSAGGQHVPIASASEDYAKVGIGNSKVSAALATDGNPQTGWSTSGAEGRRHVAVFRFAQPIDPGDLQITMLFERHYSAGLGRFRISATTDARVPQANAIPPELEPLIAQFASEVSGDSPGGLAPRRSQERARLMEYFLSIAPELAKEREAIDQLRSQMPAHPTSLALAERPPENRRPTYRYHRGEFLQPKEQVEPGVPAILHSFPSSAPRTRLEFARWLVARENPLVARVTVNRHWAAFFGRGLVRTTEDFGFQGELPTHPELLDWLAIEFMRAGWSQKALHRLIVTSATYRQSSRVTPELLAKDPENRLLARGPRVRLEAELVRDYSLRVSNLLSPKLGGPSVFPPQPAGVTTEGAYGRLDWNVSTGADRFRRGLYTFTKRTTPFAMTLTFDGPSGEACVARREVSNTPLQALTLLNDTVFLEAAQALGRQWAAAAGSNDERIARLFVQCIGRPPASEEIAALAAFLGAQKHRLSSGALDPKAIAGTADGNVDEIAAWALTARAILNLDEAITKG